MDAPLRADVSRSQVRGFHTEGVGDRLQYVVAGAAGTSLDGPNRRVRDVSGRGEGGLREAARTAAGGNALTDRARAVVEHSLNVPMR